MMSVSDDMLRKILRYEPETGKLFWLPRTADMFSDTKQTAIAKCNAWNAKFAGRETFIYANCKGYRKGIIFGKMYRAHRIVWFLHHGEWPSQTLDHINGDRSDNRIENLRDVPHVENLKNQKRNTRNTSGVVGVYWNAKREKYRAYIYVDGVQVYLGSFCKFEDAVARRKAEETTRGFHPNHGRAA